ncbi:four helix bundle protein [Planctellipticum variicoloris]|uniref:four helix bundle protein n=1 Tax=Planctellipticum variicoloris TaxID=3064265 RepID=UPI003014000F|nr:four helix bundle protein [Planctomycetaceae bacterium SH412]
MTGFNFEKLTVWQKAIEYAELIYEATSHFPRDERFGLTNQLRRASVSISSNIAEGSSRSSRTDFRRFIEIAYGSLLETVSQIQIAKRRGFLTESDHERIYVLADELARMLSGLGASLKSQG